ncbi:hypothetical protein BIV57_01170 [Mangrovactinospora gilvigrisea]|uniref:SHOCT domain-containing protein n=1 Tax=Mangrovactinospora gilvigrisea TaxID=1428644 RepID=A0A1J7CIL3_9ACTN|nr:SHOCT domain-containing protein [Mangrovactinospora gilvigrisea]OIV39474.1 hypothetical protein BIV57_01170 [Mangrovactinospora gilvigrisea]
MSNYPLLNIFWTMAELFIWILWLFLLIRIISDIFRSEDLGGWGKAGWTVLVILLPFIGVLAYLIARGRTMHERDVKQQQKMDDAFKKYVRDAAASPDADGSTSGSGSGSGSHADELSRLAELRSSGALTEEEFQKAKDKILA